MYCAGGPRKYNAELCTNSANHTIESLMMHCSSREPLHQYSHRPIGFGWGIGLPADAYIMLATLTGYMPVWMAGVPYQAYQNCAAFNKFIDDGKYTHACRSFLM